MTVPLTLLQTAVWVPRLHTQPRAELLRKPCQHLLCDHPATIILPRAVLPKSLNWTYAWKLGILSGQGNAFLQRGLKF